MGLHGLDRDPAHSLDRGDHGMVQEVARVSMSKQIRQGDHGPDVRVSGVPLSNATDHGLSTNQKLGAQNQTQGAHGLVGEAARVSRSFHNFGDQGLQGTSARVFGDGFLSQVAARGVLTSQEKGAHGLVGETSRVYMHSQKQDYGDQGLKRTDSRVLHGDGSGSEYNQISPASLTRAAGPFKEGCHDERRVPQQTRFKRDALQSTDGDNDPQRNASIAVGPSFAQ
ncbi:hypothetical protein TorRG33x02_305600, partial [Trema orientale]